MNANPGERYLSLCDAVKERALQCGRNPASIRIIAVTKQHSFEEWRSLHNAGCRDVGENRIQEALPKISEAPADIQWHFIGSLQKNKAHKLIGHFTLTHSIDSLELAQRISTLSNKNHCTTSLLFEVNVSGEASKHGFDPEQLAESFPLLLALPNLDIRGLMTMAPANAPLKTVSACFRGLRELRDRLFLQYKFPLPELSMGMSDDYPIAIAEGATLLRIGSALFRSY